MILTFIAPIITPQFTVYRTLTGTLRVYVGFLTDSVNFVSNTILTNWSLRDMNNIVVSTGQVNVIINSFDSYVDLVGLLNNRYYIFTIGNQSASILTFTDMSQFTTINEHFKFDEMRFAATT